MPNERSKKNSHNEWKRQLKKLPWLLLLPLGIFLPRLAAQYPQWIETHYSQKIYPVISAWMGKLNSLTRVSLAECILFVLVILVVVMTFVYLYRLLFRRIRFSAFVGYLLSLCIAGGVLLNLFYIMWGFNYSRPQLSALLSLPVEQRSVDELEEACLRLASEANALRDHVPEDENGVFMLEGGYEAYFDKVPNAYARLGIDYPLFARRTYAAKGVISSVGLSYAGISGIFIPHTGEPNVNVDQPALLLPATAAHETAHYLGIAREDEANFISYLACIHSDDPALAYSGTMLALIHCGNKLYAADKDKYSALYATYDEGLVRDIRNNNAYWDSFEGPVEEAATKLNDNYLKFNQQENGVKSYGMMVDLILAYFAAGN